MSDSRAVGQSVCPGNHAVDAIAERLKDVADEIGAKALRASIPTGRDQWVSVEVSHAWLWGDSPDGWDVAIEERSL